MGFPWFSKRSDDPRMLAYENGTPKRIPRKKPVEALRFLVLDTETTGLRVHEDHLLSLAMVEVQAGDLRVASAVEWLIYQPAAKVTEAVSVHGILPSETAGGQPEGEVMDELLPMLTGAVLVGHHIGFDAAMINAALHKRFRLRLRNPMVDTAILAMHGMEAFARSGYANQRPPTLDELCAHCGIQAMERHRAAGDAFTTAEIFLLICARLRKNLGRSLRAGDLPFSTV